LHEGLRNNPDSYDILFELGRLYDESYHDTDRARNVWESRHPQLAQARSRRKRNNRLIFEQITTHLAKLEEDAGNLPDAMNWYQAAQKVSASRPNALQAHIDAASRKNCAQLIPAAPAKLSCGRFINSAWFSAARSGLIDRDESAQSKIKRHTLETKISVRLNLDGKGKSSVKTGIPFFDHMLTLFAKHATMDLHLHCNGDLEVDAHHTVEDCGIALGQAVCDRARRQKGIRRYGFGFSSQKKGFPFTGEAYVPMDECLARCVS
jgi:hypothetical protein